MLDNRILDELSQRLSALIPVAEGMRDDLRTIIAQTLKSSLKDLDILTREEFDSQAQALERARLRVTALEQQISQLEQRLDELEAGSS